jgi:hypothetical protein
MAYKKSFRDEELDAEYQLDKIIEYRIRQEEEE